MKREVLKMKKMMKYFVIEEWSAVSKVRLKQKCLSLSFELTLSSLLDSFTHFYAPLVFFTFKS